MAGSCPTPAGKRQGVASRAVSDHLREKIEARLRFGHTYGQIAEELDEARRRGELDWAPSERTIRWWVDAGKVRRPARPEDPWSLLSGRPEDVGLVVPLVALFASLPESTRWLSIREAEIVVRLRRAAPDLHIVATATLASLYVERERLGRSMTDLDLYVSVGPWRDDSLEAQRAYLVVCAAAGVPAIHVGTGTPGELLVALAGTATGSGSAYDATVRISHTRKLTPDERAAGRAAEVEE